MNEMIEHLIKFSAHDNGLGGTEYVFSPEWMQEIRDYIERLEAFNEAEKLRRAAEAITPVEE